MLHIVYQIKCLLKNKELIFWSLVFPILLGVMFNFAFGSINEQFRFMQISLGMVHCEKEEHLPEILQQMKTEDGEPMFLITEFDSEELAQKALADKKITGFVNCDNDCSLTVMKSDIQASIIKSVLDEYRTNAKLIEKAAAKFYSENHPEKFQSFLISFKNAQEVKIREIPLKGRDKDSFTQYFFALLAMTCLIASQCGMENCIHIQPDLSAVGARRNISPMKKMKQVTLDFIASYFLYCIITSIVVAVCIWGFKRDFGDNIFLVLLTTWAGSFTGMTVGTVIGVAVRGTEAKKSALCTAFFLVSSFLAGLQWGNIVYLIEQKVPFINRINPATLIVNSYSSLMVFGDLKEYSRNMITLVGMGVLCLVISILKLRRQKYANL